MQGAGDYSTITVSTSPPSVQWDGKPALVRLEHLHHLSMCVSVGLMLPFVIAGTSVNEVGEVLIRIRSELHVNYNKPGAA